MPQIPQLPQISDVPKELIEKADNLFAANNDPSISSLPKNRGNMDQIKAIAGAMSNADQWATDPYKTSRITPFGTDAHSSMLEHYRTHPLYGKLGFSPYKDNENLYNEKSTWFQDFRRMTHQWGGLFSTGLTDMWSDMFSPASLTADLKHAKEMEEGMIIGSSTKDGFGAGLTNFALNTAYTVGIMTEMLLEEVALFAGTVATGGLDAGVTLPLMAARAGKGFKAIYESGKILGKTVEAFKNVSQTFARSKEFFNMSKSGAKSLDMAKSFGKWLMPGQNLADLYKSAKAGKTSWTELGDIAKVTSTAGAFWRDLREIRAVTSESRLEAGTTYLKVKDDLYNDFLAKNGDRAPTDAERTEIEQRALAASHSDAIGNVALIYLSNKIVLRNALKGWKPAAKMLEETAAGKGGKELIDATVKGAKVKTYELVNKYSFKNMKNAFKPSNIMKKGLRYTAANFAEGIQESGQDILSVAAADYYEQPYLNPDVIGHKGYLSSIMTGMSSQATGAGLETFLSGFFMGGALQAPQHLAFNTLPKSIYRMQGTYGGEKAQAKYKAYKKSEEEYNNNLLNAANTVAGKGTLGLRAIDYNFHHQTEMEKEMKTAGDMKTQQDARDDSIFHHIYTLLRSGRADILRDTLSGLKEMSTNDLADAFDMSSASEEDKAKLAQSIPGFNEKIDAVEKHFKFIQETFENPIPDGSPNPFLQQKRKDVEYYKMLATFSLFNIDRTAERMNSVIQEFVKNSPLKDAPTTGFTAMFSTEAMANEMQQLQADIDIYKLSTDAEGKTKHKESVTKLENLQNYVGSAQLYGSLYGMLSKATKNTKVAQDNYDNAVAQVNTQKAQIEASDRTAEQKAEAITALEQSLVEKETAKKNAEEEESSTKDQLAKASGTFYKAYSDHVNHMGQTIGKIVLTPMLEKTFPLLKDHIALHHENNLASNALNSLLNPEVYKEYMVRAMEREGVSEQQRAAKMKEALDIFLQRKKNNDMLNEIAALGVFIPPDQIESLIDKFEVPSDFYEFDKQTLQPGKKVEPGTDLYEKIDKIIDKYAGVAKKEKTGKPIPEQRGTSEFDTGRRDKFPGDKRTYKELAEEFGVNLDDAESTSSLKTVLETLLKSKYATVREKSLIRKLLAKVTPDMKVVFRKDMSTPGHYIIDEGISIDLRYNASDYRGGNNPVEYIILHEVLHQFTSKGLLTDPTFKAEITKLLELAKAHSKTKAYKDKYGNKPLYGLKNEDEFIAEAMTNEVFQNMLRSIKINVTTRSAWDDFTGSIRSFFKRLFKLDDYDDQTALDQALGIITTWIDKGALTGEKVEPVKETPSPVSEMPAGNMMITTATPIEEILKPEHKVLADKLVAAFKAYDQEKSDVPLPTKGKSNEWIMKQKDFKNFFLMIGSAVSPILDAYNKSTQRTEQPKVTQPVVKQKPIVKTPVSDVNIDTQIKDLGVKLENLPFDTINKLGKLLGTKGSFKEIEDVAHAIAYHYYHTPGDVKVRDAVDAELAALGTTTAGVFTPSTPYGTPTGKPLTTASTETDQERKQRIADGIALSMSGPFTMYPVGEDQVFYNANKEEINKLVEKAIVDINEETGGSIWQKLADEYVGKFIYATPGAGKSTIAKTVANVVDTDQLIIDEMTKRHPDFTRDPGELDGDFIFRYVKEHDHKAEINKQVLKQVKKLLKEDKTVLTGTIAFAGDVDIAFTIPSSNPRVVERFGTKAKADKFITTEKAALKKADIIPTELTSADLAFVLTNRPAPPVQTQLEFGETEPEISTDIPINRNFGAPKIEESFAEFRDRFLGELIIFMMNGQDKSVIVTHAEGLNLIKAWELALRPTDMNEFSKIDAADYAEEDTKPGIFREIELFGKTFYIVSSASTGQEEDTPNTKLSEKGKKESELIANKLKDKGITTVVSSPYPRAVETAEIIDSIVGSAVPEEKATQNVIERIEAAKDITELLKIEDNIFEEYRSQINIVANITAKMIEAAVAKKRTELAKEVDFDNINVGNLLIMKNKSKFGKHGLGIVTAKTDKDLTVVPYQGGGPTIVTKGVVKDNVEFHSKTWIQPEDLAKPITDAEKKVIDDSVKNTDKATKQDENRDIINKAAETKTTKSDEDAFGEFGEDTKKDCI